MQTYLSFDGSRISFLSLGEGRLTLALHGFMADATLNFVQPGIAARLVEAGRRVVMPDLRGHGASAVAPEPGRYPPDALAMDQESLLAHLGADDYDLIGYSLGARTAMRMLTRGARPRRAVLGGMGDSGIMNVAARRAFFEDGILNGAQARNAQAGAYIKASLAQRGLDPQAMLSVLAQQVNTPRDALARIETPILVVSGEKDEDNGSAEALAAYLPNAASARVPGDHLTAVIAPELPARMIAFLNAEAV